MYIHDVISFVILGDVHGATIQFCFVREMFVCGLVEFAGCSRWRMIS